MVDADWFQTRLKAVNKNQAQLAKFLGIAESAVSRVMTQKRRWQAREIPLVARFLGASIEDVHLHSGEQLTGIGAAFRPPADEELSSETMRTDGALLGEIFAILKRVHESGGISVTTNQLGEMAASEYDDIAGLPSDPARRLQELTRLETRLRRWVRERGVREVVHPTKDRAGRSQT